jgi:acyl-CoA reductase-like NAD-dependent aldehyde dehydrogenase
VLSWINEATAEGAAVLTGGQATHGSIVAPTVLTGVSPATKVVHSEVFGPVCSVVAYDSIDEALDLANATPHGLQAGIFTRDLSTALRAALALEFGGVIVNDTPTFRTDQMPYGGVKASGNTKEGPRHAVREMTEERLVVVQV